MGALLSALGNPQHRLPPVIHVAGTNGKGSTIAFVRSMLEASGRLVHTYTSPHLVQFNERIRVAGKLIGDDELTDTLEEVEAANSGGPITFFEATTAAAFLAFSRHRADFTILETGMGGRLDATNVVAHPAVTAITPISLDHTNYLGTTVSRIAREKAGIFRTGAPVAVGPQCAEVAEVLSVAARKCGTTLFEYDRHWRVAGQESRLSYSGNQQLILPRPLLRGDHQLTNAGLALAIIELIPSLRLNSADYMRGILQTEWPARLMPIPSHAFDDFLPPNVKVFLDGGHNEGAAEAIAKWAEGIEGNLDIVVGMLDTKNVCRFLKPLSHRVRRLIGIAIPGNANCYSAIQIVKAAREVGIDQADPAINIYAALDALSEPPIARQVLICGSLDLAGRVMSDLNIAVDR